MGIRPEDIYDTEDKLAELKDSKVKLVVDVAELLGAETNIYTDVNGHSVCASVTARDDLRLGDEIVLAFDMKKTHFFDADTEFRLRYDYNLPEEGVANPQIIPSDYQGLDLEMEGYGGQYTDEPSEEIEKGFFGKIKGFFKKFKKDKDVEEVEVEEVDVEEVDVEETKSNKTTTKESKEK